MGCPRLTYHHEEKPTFLKVWKNPKTTSGKVDWYDYGRRFYDPQLARFHSLDPFSEKYSFQSPYLYAYNNPIRFIDYLGMSGQEPGSTQIYVKLGASFGPQLGFNIGDIVSGTLRAFNVKGELKVGINISPEGKVSFLYDQSSKNVNYERSGSIPLLGGKSKSSEYGVTEHPVFAEEKTETQKGVVKETVTETYESVTTTESTTYEVGAGVNAAIVGVKAAVGFEYIESSETKMKTNDTQNTEKKEDETK